MRSFILMFLGFLFIMCPFTIIIGIYLIDKGLNEIEKEIKKMNREIDINKFNKSITFQNRGIGFTQIGIAGEILDLIDDLQQENKQLKENWATRTKSYNKVVLKNTDLEQENKQLKEDYQLELEENSKLSELWCKNNKILTELEEWCKNGINDDLKTKIWKSEINGIPIELNITTYEFVLDKIQELKVKYK